MAKTDKVKNPMNEVKQEWEVLIPLAPGRMVRAGVAPRLSTLYGKRIGLFWNTKPNGDVFLLRVGQLLKERFKDLKTVEFLPGKANSAVGAPESAIREAADRCDLVILTTGD